MAVLAPMPSARVRTVVAVKTGLLRRVRAARIRSRNSMVGSSSSLTEIAPPGRPVVFLPAFRDSLIVLFRHVDMDEIDAAILAFRCKGGKQRRSGTRWEEETSAL